MYYFEASVLTTNAKNETEIKPEQIEEMIKRWIFSYRLEENIRKGEQTPKDARFHVVYRKDTGDGSFVSGSETRIPQDVPFSLPASKDGSVPEKA